MSNDRSIPIGKFDKKMAPEAKAPDAAPEPELEWHLPHAAPLRLAGFAWFAQDRLYRRMPKQPAEALPEAVDGLANCTAGGQTAFRTDSPVVAVKVKLRAPANMDHMPATGQCGFDAYLGEPGAAEPKSKPRFVGITRFKTKDQEYTAKLFTAADDDETAAAGELRHITINFPLYQGVDEVHVGLAKGARVEAPKPWARPRPVLVYGTSITQGGCAARPGMAYTNILSRMLNVEVVNLGFSGSGKGEPEVARTIASVPDPQMLVLDYEANAMGTEKYRESLPVFVEILRAKHPKVPLLVVSRIQLTSQQLSPAKRADAGVRLAMQKELVEKRRAAGDKAIHFFEGTTLLGEDWDECTVDGSHPTDLGFARMAYGLEPTFRRMLKL
ncbi:MAG: SGNH/GDSL hydrolase family protein [Planctomycetes bacterium]|nr:SGNH/GDSL hydrolase family protein [Planctomycetota bacterium]